MLCLSGEDNFGEGKLCQNWDFDITCGSDRDVEKKVGLFSRLR